jgi:uncharacterized DUF497 family protein
LASTEPAKKAHRELLGMIEGQLLNVAYAERSSCIRLISARRATKKEKDDYFTQNSQT